MVVLLALSAITGCARDPQPNLLLITLDTTRADHCSLDGYQRPTTPVLEALGARGTVFDTTYATSPTTGPSHATIFTGALPTVHGLRTNGQRLDPGIVTLAEVLRTAGYQTAGVASSFVLERRFGFDRGFSVWRDRFARTGSSLKLAVWEGHRVPGGFDRPADETTDLAIDWLNRVRRADRPFFLFVHYFEPHGPFEPPDRWRRRFAAAPGAGELEMTLARYDACIAFTDDEIGRLIRVLTGLGLADETLIVVTADHGEGFMSHGAMSHGPHLYEEAVRIPLLLHWPGRIPVETHRATPVSLLDLAPTIVELLGVEPAGMVLQGRNLFSDLAADGPPIRPVPLFRGRVPRKLIGGRWVEGERTAIRSGRWKYLTSTLEPPELFDLEADPDERNNCIGDHPGQAERLHAELESWFPEPGEPSSAEPPLDEESHRALEALGYVP